MTRIARMFVIVGLALAACGDGGGGGGDDTPGNDGGGSDIDGGGGDHPDGRVPEGCGGADAPQCNDCIDNDGDGDIDGFDVECTGAIDDDESSFATGIPGDNMDLVNQDCFFDGDSGAGNDGCNRHVCCILGLDATECDDGGYDNNFDPGSDCPPVDPECLEVCAPVTPPGCDCFGCCTICDDTGCVDIYTNPAIAPDCDADSIHDPAACPACTKVADCGVDCTDDPSDCVLCPGQDPNDLPDSCSGQECPGGATACTDNTDCTSTEFCSTGCCLAVVD
jgi:hypothetical protein